MNYEEKMQTLITKTTIEFAIIISLIVLVVAIAWIAPSVYYRKRKNKRIADKEKKTSLMAQIALTAICCLLLSLIAISNYKDISNMKKDIETKDFVTYIGDYSINNTYRFSSSPFSIWFDLRGVTIENDEELLWFDITSDFNTEMIGSGTIVYGRNSRYVVKIESAG